MTPGDEAARLLLAAIEDLEEETGLGPFEDTRAALDRLVADRDYKLVDTSVARERDELARRLAAAEREVEHWKGACAHWNKIGHDQEREVEALRTALERIADNPCAVFPTPGPTRDADDKLVWPSNCVTQKNKTPCMSCIARAAVGVSGHEQ